MHINSLCFLRESLVLIDVLSAMVSRVIASVVPLVCGTILAAVVGVRQHTTHTRTPGSFTNVQCSHCHVASGGGGGGPKSSSAGSTGSTCSIGVGPEIQTIQKCVKNGWVTRTVNCNVIRITDTIFFISEEPFEHPGLLFGRNRRRS